MVDQLEDSTREVFVVRLWREKRPGAAWVGQVQRICTGVVVRVRNPGELLEYLASQFSEVDSGSAR